MHARTGVHDPQLMAAGEALSANRLPDAERLLRDRLRGMPNDVAAMRMLAELGAAPLPLASVRGFIGRGVANLVRQVLAATPGLAAVDEAAALALFERHYIACNGRHSTVFPGVLHGLGLLRRLDTGAQKTRVLGFLSRGGTLDVGGMLFANRTTWAHAVAAAADAAGLELEQLLEPAELRAVRGQDNPRTIMSQY